MWLPNERSFEYADHVQVATDELQEVEPFSQEEVPHSEKDCVVNVIQTHEQSEAMRPMKMDSTVFQ